MVCVPKVGNLLFEQLSETFFDFLKFVFLLVCDGSDTVRTIAVNVTSAEGKTVVDQCRIYHATTLCTIEKIAQITEVTIATTYAVSVNRWSIGLSDNT